MRGDEASIQSFSEFEYSEAIIPLACDAEMRFGFSYGSKPSINLANYELFKQQFGLTVQAPDQDTAIIYAELATWSRKNGIALSNNDVWIAAATVQSGGQLFTTDKDFERLPQVRLAK